MGRFVLLATVLAGLALAAAAPAFGDTTEFYAIAYDTALGRSSDTELDVFLPPSGPAEASIVFYAPQGYGVTVGQPAGTKIGAVAANVTVGGSTTAVEADGDLVADDPAKYVGNTCAPGIHAAVFVANLSAAGVTVQVPLYVDPTSGADTAIGSFKIQACLASPDVPAAMGGAPGGLRLIEADLDFATVFTNPAATGNYTWSVFETPFAAGTTTPDPAGTVEARSIVGLPKLFSVKWALDAKKDRRHLQGQGRRRRQAARRSERPLPRLAEEDRAVVGIRGREDEGGRLVQLHEDLHGLALRLRARQPLHQRLVLGGRLDGAGWLRVRVDRPLVRADPPRRGAEEEVGL